MDDLRLRATASTEIDQLLSLYQSVAATPNSGLTRRAEEIGRDYVEALPSYRNPRGNLDRGFPGRRSRRRVPRRADATAPVQPRAHGLDGRVHPQAQGLGVGSRLFAALFEATARLTPPVTGIELVARTGNAAAIRL